MRQRIARRLAVLGALLLAIVGIVVIAPESTALNVTGIHTVHFNCVAGGQNSTTDFTYSLTDTGASYGGTPPNYSDPTYHYSFQLLSSTYHGTTPPQGRSPALAIGSTGPTTPGSELFLSAGFGGYETTANYAWPRFAAVAGATLTDGINVNWVPVPTEIRPKYQSNSRLRFSIYNIPACTQYLDLGFPDAPHELGNLSHQFSCSTSPGGPFYILNLDYSVTQVAGNTYEFHVEQAHFFNDTSQGNAASDVSMDIAGIGRPAEVVDSGSSNWSNPPSPDFTEVDGVFGVTFPTVTWDYQPGQHPNVGVVFTHGTDTCEQTIDLGYNWDPTGIGSDPAFETIVFDDCSSQPTELKVRPVWEYTTDRKYFRLRSLSIYQSNSSVSKIVLDVGTATIPGGVTVSELKNPAKQLVTIGAGVSLADRTITSGETQTFPVGEAGKWERVSADVSHSAAPNSFYTPADRYPTVHIRGKVYNSIGAQCVPSIPGGSGDITTNGLDFQPDVVL